MATKSWWRVWTRSPDGWGECWTDYWFGGRPGLDVVQAWAHSEFPRLSRVEFIREETT